jgi:protocatechuate 3,4-dioxygenase beta subunit
MEKKSKHTRRDVTRQFGIAAGVALLAPELAVAATATPEQVEGPFHPVDEQADTDIDLTLIKGHAKSATGEIILVRGRVLDVSGQPLTDALVDVWQANHYGRYSHAEDPNTAPLDPDFQGWGLMKTDADGRYGFKTIKPGPYPLSFLGEEGWRCMHIHFKVSRRGYQPLTTQMYFPGDPLMEQDLEIAKAPAAQRHQLIAKAEIDTSSGLPLFRFEPTLNVIKT